MGIVVLLAAYKAALMLGVAGIRLPRARAYSESVIFTAGLAAIGLANLISIPVIGHALVDSWARRLLGGNSAGLVSNLLILFGFWGFARIAMAAFGAGGYVRVAVNCIAAAAGVTLVALWCSGVRDDFHQSIYTHADALARAYIDVLAAALGSAAALVLYAGLIALRDREIRVRRSAVALLVAAIFALGLVATMVVASVAPATLPQQAGGDIRAVWSALGMTALAVAGI